MRISDWSSDVCSSDLNLREISSIRDPKYSASADLLQLNFEADISSSLTFFSQTAYNEDKVRSFQDFARYNSAPAFIDTSGLIEFDESPNAYRNLSPGRSEEHTSELQSLMRISYAVFCLKKNK